MLGIFCVGLTLAFSIGWGPMASAKSKYVPMGVTAGTTGSMDCSKETLVSDEKSYVFNDKPASEINQAQRNYIQNYRCMVCNCFNEAGNQSPEGQIAVGKVVMTRSRMTNTFPQSSGRDDHSLCGIIKDNRQFSWLNSPKSVQDVPNGSSCFQTMHDAMAFTQGFYADYYFNPKLARPKWAKSMKLVDSIGDHTFYSSNMDSKGSSKKKSKKKGKH